MSCAHTLFSQDFDTRVRVLFHLTRSPAWGLAGPSSRASAPAVDRCRNVFFRKFIISTIMEKDFKFCVPFFVRN